MLGRHGYGWAWLAGPLRRWTRQGATKSRVPLGGARCRAAELLRQPPLYTVRLPVRTRAGTELFLLTLPPLPPQVVIDALKSGKAVFVESVVRGPAVRQLLTEPAALTAAASRRCCSEPAAPGPSPSIPPSELPPTALQHAAVLPPGLGLFAELLSSFPPPFPLQEHFSAEELQQIAQLAGAPGAPLFMSGGCTQPPPCP